MASPFPSPESASIVASRGSCRCSPVFAASYVLRHTCVRVRAITIYSPGGRLALSQSERPQLNVSQSLKSSVEAVSLEARTRLRRHEQQRVIGGSQVGPAVRVVVLKLILKWVGGGIAGQVGIILLGVQSPGSRTRMSRGMGPANPADRLARSKMESQFYRPDDIGTDVPGMGGVRYVPNIAGGDREP